MNKKVEDKAEYAFYAGRLDEEEVTRYSKNHELYEFGTDLFQNQVSFSAYGDDLRVTGSGKLVEDPHPVLRVDLNKDKSFIKDAEKSTDAFLKDDHSVLLTRIRVCCDRHKYIDKNGQERTFKRYGIVPVFANSYTAKKLLLKFAKGDHISFTGAFYTTVLVNDEGEYTNRTTFFIVLRNFEGYPVVRKQRQLNKKLKGLARQKKTDSKPRNYQPTTENDSADSYRPKETPVPNNQQANRKEKLTREYYRKNHQPTGQSTESTGSKEMTSSVPKCQKTTNESNSNPNTSSTINGEYTTTSSDSTDKNDVVTVGDDDLKLDF